MGENLESKGLSCCKCPLSPRTGFCPRDYETQTQETVTGGGDS